MLIYDCGIFSIHKKNIDGPSQQGQPSLIPNNSLVLSTISSMKTSLTHVLLSDDSRVSVVIVTDIQGASIMS